MVQRDYPMMSVEDYLALERNSKQTRYEYLDGELIMLAGGSANHSLIITNLNVIIGSALRGSPCYAFNSDIKLKLSERCYVLPDLAMSCDENDRGPDDTIQHPTLVVEVLSPTTELIDRVRKFTYYQECPSIQEYMLVDSQKVKIEIYCRKEDGWLLHTYGPGSTVGLESFDIRFPIEEAYDGTRFKR